MPRTAYSTATEPAFSKTRVPLIVSPSFSGSLQVHEHEVVSARLQLDRGAGPDLEPALDRLHAHDVAFHAHLVHLDLGGERKRAADEAVGRRAGIGDAHISAADLGAARRRPRPGLRKRERTGLHRLRGGNGSGDANARRGRFQAVRILARGRHLGPFLRDTVAFLHHGEIDRRAGLIGIGEAGLEHEFVVIRIVEGAGPDDVRHALAHRFAVDLVGLHIGALGSLELPAGLRHGLDGDDALRDAHANFLGRLAGAAMGDA